MTLSIPNLTLDTSCIIALLHFGNDQTDADELMALEKLKSAHNVEKVKIWVSHKSVGESISNLENAGDDQVRTKKWLDTLTLLDEFDKAKSIWVLGVSRLGVDTVWASDEQVKEYNQIKEIVIGNKTSVKDGDIFDIAIFYEHYLQRNDLFITLDTKIFRPSVVARLLKEVGIRVLTPSQAISVLKNENQLNLN